MSQIFVHSINQRNLFIDVNNEEFNKQFWNRLQDEWKKISDRMDDQSPWLAEFSEYYDPYKVSQPYKLTKLRRAAF